MKKKGSAMMIAAMVVVGLVIFVMVALATMAQLSRSASPPGLQGGRLAQCSSRPNCVGSEYPEDTAHFTAPLTAVDIGREKLRRVIEDMAGTIVVDQEDYLAATFKSSLFGFVDDMEFRFDDENGLIHVRSASRAGYSDRGVNRKRVKELRGLLDAGTAPEG